MVVGGLHAQNIDHTFASHLIVGRKNIVDVLNEVLDITHILSVYHIVDSDPVALPTTLVSAGLLSQSDLEAFLAAVARVSRGSISWDL